MSEVILKPTEMDWMPKLLMSFHINQTNIEVLENELQDGYFEVLCYNSRHLGVYCHYVLKGEQYVHKLYMNVVKWLEESECPSCAAQHLSVKDIYPELPMKELVRIYQTGEENK